MCCALSVIEEKLPRQLTWAVGGSSPSPVLMIGALLAPSQWKPLQGQSLEIVMCLIYVAEPSKGLYIHFQDSGRQVQRFTGLAAAQDKPYMQVRLLY